MSYPWLKIAHHVGLGLSRKPLVASPMLSSLQIRQTHIVEHHTPEQLQSRVPTQMPDVSQAHKLSDPRYIYKHVRHEASQSPKPLEILLLQPVEGVGQPGDVVSISPVKARKNFLLPKLAVYASPENLDNPLLKHCSSTGVGQPGDVVSISPVKARKNFLLPKLAVYASPENLDKYAYLRDSVREDQPSSIYAKKTVQHLAGAHITVTMSLDVPWVLNAEHVSVSMRKTGIVAPPYAIQLPPKPIEGPNLDLQRKFFYVTVTVNKKERVNVRCRIHHVTVDVTRKLPYTSLTFLKEPPVAVFSEDQEYLTALFNQRPPGSPYREPQLTPEMVAQGITSTSDLSKEELAAFTYPATQAPIPTAA
ncbi:Ribosomal protein L9 N-terminal [Trinorchestia longiramus]|nr:Ribosomal protein L9 N-terminal [Trinorchestia longiramus]